MKKYIFILGVFLGFASLAKAQTTRPGVLVVGNGNAAFAAAMQSALSGVKTTILLQAGGFDIAPINNEIHSGIQAEFLKKYRDFLQIKDSLTTPQIDKQKANNVISIWTDSVKNLTVLRNIMWVRAERSGSNWSFKLSDGSAIRPKVLINPGDSKLNDALTISPTTNGWATLDYNSNLFKTSLAAGRIINNKPATYFSMYNFFIPLQENLLWISDAESMLLGQAAGATAAYAAFFDTKTSEVSLRKTQGELIHFKLNLLPFSDISYTDTTWRAIQQVAVTGVLKADLTSGDVKFSPDKLVSTAEIKQPIKDHFYKAQIWFDDYKDSKMTIGSTLEMISYVGNKSLESIKKEINKNWKTRYQFKSDFDLNRQINRREFAVLLQEYMPPFNVTIDETGKIIR